MERYIAEHLLDELKRQFTMFPVDKSKFFNALLSTPLQESSQFYEKIPANRQLVEGDMGDTYLLLRRVLRSQNAGNLQVAELKVYWEKTIRNFGAYSSNALSRNLRQNENLAEMMIENKNPFSLLGKFEIHDKTGENMRYTTRPVLIIPDVKDRKIIDEWEETNKIYEEEVGFIFKSRKRINPEKYSF